MTKFKRYIKNAFSIAGLEWRTGETTEQSTGLLMNTLKISTDTDRRIIADEQYLVSVDNFVSNIVLPVLDTDNLLYKSSFDFPETSDKDVGNVPALTPVEDLEGRSFNDILDSIFFTDPPFISVPTSNVLNRTFPVESVLEVGETTHFEATAVHNRGEIESTNGAPPVDLTGEANTFNFTDYNVGFTAFNAASDSQNFVGTNFSVVLGTMSMECEIIWENGIGSYFDEKSREQNFLDPKRVNGSQTVTTSIRGAYKYFFGSGAAASAPINSAGVRALADQGFLLQNDTGNFGITLAPGEAEMYFFVPAGKTVTVFNQIQGSSYMTSDFVVTNLSVEDGGGNLTNYESWVLPIGGIGYLEEQAFIIQTA